MKGGGEETEKKHHRIKEETRRAISSEIEQDEDNLMVSKALSIPVLLLFSVFLVAICEVHNHNTLKSNGSILAGMQFSHHNFNVVDCGLSTSDNGKPVHEEERKGSVMISLKHRPNGDERAVKDSLAAKTGRPKVLLKAESL